MALCSTQEKECLRNLGGLTRLGIVVLAFLLIDFMVYPLQIYNFTLFNSGVSVVIAILVLVWVGYSVSVWISEGF